MQTRRCSYGRPGVVLKGEPPQWVKVARCQEPSTHTVTWRHVEDPGTWPADASVLCEAHLLECQQENQLRWNLDLPLEAQLMVATVEPVNH